MGVMRVARASAAMTAGVSGRCGWLPLPLPVLAAPQAPTAAATTNSHAHTRTLHTTPSLVPSPAPVSRVASVPSASSPPRRLQSQSVSAAGDRTREAMDRYDGGPMDRRNGASHDRTNQRHVDGAQEVKSAFRTLERVRVATHMMAESSSDADRMLQNAHEALETIQRHVSTVGLTRDQYAQLFLYLKEERLFSHAVPFWRALQSHLQSEWRRVAESPNGTPTSSISVTPQLPLIGRVPAKIVGLVLQCLSAARDSGPDGALAALCWIREQSNERFDRGVVNVNSILKAYATKRPIQVDHMRTCFDSIPAEWRDERTFGIMIDGYTSAHRLDGVRDIINIMRNAGQDTNAHIVDAYFRSILPVCTGSDDGARLAALREADEWWSDAKSRHAHLIDAHVVTSMMKLHTGHLARQMEIFKDAIRLEMDSTTHHDADGEVAAGTESLRLDLWDVEIHTNSRIYVDSYVVGYLVSEIAHSPRPAQMRWAVTSLWQWMLARSDAAEHALQALPAAQQKRHLLARLAVKENVVHNYLDYYQRSHLDDDLLRLWRAVTNEMKQRSRTLYLPMLGYCARVHDGALAARLMDEYDSLGLTSDLLIFHRWLECYTDTGDVDGAERVLHRMRDAKMPHHETTYVRMLETYIVATARNPHDVVHLDRLVDEMRANTANGQPLILTALDYQTLINRSRAVGLPEIESRWSQLAQHGALISNPRRRARRRHFSRSQS